MKPHDIRALREQLKLSQQQFADVLGLSAGNTHISRMEAGRNRPSGPVLLLMQLYADDPALARRVLRRVQAAAS